jgi:hypothetical protein
MQKLSTSAIMWLPAAFANPCMIALVAFCKISRNYKVFLWKQFKKYIFRIHEVKKNVQTKSGTTESTVLIF